MTRCLACREACAGDLDAVVRELASTTGRGPTKAKTTLGENAVFDVLQDTLTRGERTLVEAGERGGARPAPTLAADHAYQFHRQDPAADGRNVIGFMSDNHIDPDIAVEVFILEPGRTGGPGRDRGGRSGARVTVVLNAIAPAAVPAWPTARCCLCVRGVGNFIVGGARSARGR